MWRRVLQIDCSALTTPDLADVERLARLHLELKRRGCGLRLTRVSPELRDLLAFAGLAGALGLEPRRQTEQREQSGGVEEEGDLLDPPLS